METTTILDHAGTRNLHTEWTDEKHSLYLKGMEATFVNQLYASAADTIDLQARKESSLFKVFQGGCWKKVCYGKADLQLNREEDDSRYPRESPWIRHFRPRRGHQAIADPALEETAESVDCRSQSREGMAFSFKLAASSEQFHPDHGHSRVRDLEDCENEVSDQNFVGEDIEVKKTSSVSAPKRIKRQSTDHSNNDQEGSSS